MCGIAGIISFTKQNKLLTNKLELMNSIQNHRGPDDSGIWQSENNHIGFAHKRLSIIDISKNAKQPMQSKSGNVIIFNGEIYNYLELRDSLEDQWQFHTKSDTEVILALYEKYGEDCLHYLRGMFAFAIYDKKHNKVFCARDRFGIKPFYYANINNTFYFASEAKAIIPFLPDINLDETAFLEYITFQYNLGQNTLFKNVKTLLPAHSLTLTNTKQEVKRYWEVHYNINFANDSEYFIDNIKQIIDESSKLHLRSDVETAVYLSGGVDSSLIGSIISDKSQQSVKAFHGRFTDYQGYDESNYAKEVADNNNLTLFTKDITANDFADNIHKIIYHLDYPVAGPGSFPQFMVSQLASQNVKVILGGQGGDELFGGYARYLIAYFEQCIKAAIDDNYSNGNFVVTLESIIPNLSVLQEYKPLLKQFWQQGLFDNLDNRYFQLINRAADLEKEIYIDDLDKTVLKQHFNQIFNQNNVGKEAYFDKMTHFDFKCLLPALLQVEDRMSMAHSIESRVPLLDTKVVEFAATIPADIKFPGGKMKHILKTAYKEILPKAIINRRDKMGFPVPLKEYFSNELKSFLFDNFNSIGARNRPYFNAKEILKTIEADNARYSRKLWGLLSLEIWYQQYFDNFNKIKYQFEQTEKEIVI